MLYLTVRLYGCETWSVTLKEKRSVRVFENGVLKEIRELKREELRESGEYYIVKNFKLCTRTSHQIFLG